VLERDRGLVELHVDHSVAAERPEVIRVALHHFVAVGERLLIFAQEVIDGRPLVPAFGELRLTPDDLAEGLDGLLALARVHLLEASREEPVDGRVARSAPHLPHRALRVLADDLVVVAQRRGQLRQIAHEPGLAQRFSAQAPTVGAALVGKRLERLLARRAGEQRRRRQGERDEHEGPEPSTPHGSYASLTVVVANPGWVPPPGT